MAGWAVAAAASPPVVRRLVSRRAVPLPAASRPAAPPRLVSRRAARPRLAAARPLAAPLPLVIRAAILAPIRAAIAAVARSALVCCNGCSAAAATSAALRRAALRLASRAAVLPRRLAVAVTNTNLLVPSAAGSTASPLKANYGERQRRDEGPWSLQGPFALESRICLTACHRRRFA